MYQLVTLQIYSELESPVPRQMSKVLFMGTVACVVLFTVTGVWGYVTFINFPGYTQQKAHEDANILAAPYPKGKIPILIGNLALFFVIVTVSCLQLLPAKDSVEEIVAAGDPSRRLSN